MTDPKNPLHLIGGNPNNIDPPDGDNPLKIIGDEALVNLQKTVGANQAGDYYDPLADEVMRLAGSVNHRGNVYMDQRGLLASSQSTFEQLGNMLLGGAKNFAAGFLDNFNYDIPQMLDLFAGTEREYGNALSKLTDSIREGAQDNPIYTGEHSFSDPAYWMTQGQNFAYSGGLMTGALLEQLGLTAATSATLGASAPLQALLASNKVRMGATLAFGSMKGIHEGYINALETYNSTYDKYTKELGYSHDDAVKIASLAASKGYKMEVGPLMALNALQFGAIKKIDPFRKGANQLGFGYGDAAQAMFDPFTKGIKSKFAKNAADYAVSSITEGIEEGIQTGISKYVQYDALRKSGHAFTDFELFDNEMYDSIIGGMLGGTVFKGLGDAISAVKPKMDTSTYGKAMDEFVAGSKQRLVNDLSVLEGANESGDILTSDLMRYKIQKNNIYDALRLDYLNQKSTGFESYIEHLQNISRAASSNNLEDLKSYDIEQNEDLNELANRYNQYIRDAENTKNNFISNYNKTNDFHSALKITESQQIVRHINETKVNIDQAIEKAYSEDVVYQGLSDLGKELYKLEVKRLAIANKIEENKQLNDQTREELENLNTRINEIRVKENINIDEIYSSDIQEKLTLETALKDTDEAIEKAYQNIAYWKQPMHIRQAQVRKAYKDIDKARTIEQLTQVQEELKEENIQSSELETLIKVKQEEVKLHKVQDESSVGQLPSDKIPYEYNEGNYQEETIEDSIGLQKGESVISVDEFFSEEKSDVTFDKKGYEDSMTKKEKENYEKPLNETGKDIANKITNKGNSIQDFMQSALKAAEIDKTEINAKKDSSLSDLMKKALSGAQISKGDMAPLDIPDIPPHVFENWKSLIREFYEYLTEELGRVPTFEEYIRDYIKHNNKNISEKIYNLIVEGWVSNGYKKADFDFIYKKLFRTRKEIFRDMKNMASQIFGEAIRDEEELSKQDEKSIKKAIKNQSPIVDIDDNGNPITEIEVISKAEASDPKYKSKNSYKTTLPTLKLAHKSMKYNRIFTEQEDGTVSVEEKDVGQDLIRSDDIDNWRILDPDSLAPGTVLSMKIPDNYKDIYINVYHEDGKVKGTMPFGSWEAINKIKHPRGSEGWLAKVPIIAYENGREEGVAFAHDPDWYNEINVVPIRGNNQHKEFIAEGKRRVQKLRTKVFKEGEVEVKITEKRPGTLTKVKDNERISINQANPESILAISNSAGDLILSNGKLLSQSNITIANKQPIGISGKVYHLRKATKPNEYIVLNTGANTINNKIQETLYNALRIYSYGPNHPEFINTRNEVLEISGLDITDSGDIVSFLKMFTNVHFSNARNNNELWSDINRKVLGKIKDGDPYIFMNGDAIVFGIKGETFFKSGYRFLRISPRNTNLREDLKNFTENGLKEFRIRMAPKIMMNVSEQAMIQNKNVPHIKNNLVVDTLTNYTDLVKDTLTTNIKSYNVGTDEKPIYATFIQTVVNYEVIGEEDEDITIETVSDTIAEDKPLDLPQRKVKNENKETVENEVKEKKNKGKDEDEENNNKEKGNKQENKIEEDENQSGWGESKLPIDSINSDINRLTGELGVIKEDLGEDSVRNLYSQILIEESSGLADLSIIENFQIIDFIFNEVSTNFLVDNIEKFNTKTITQKGKEILIEYLNNKAIEINELAELPYDKAINNEKLETLKTKGISKLNYIRENIDILVNAATDKFKRYANLKEVIEDESEFISEEELFEGNYTKTSLEESVTNKLNQRLKRVFAGTIQTDREGKQIKGFLGVPKYVDYDRTISTIEQLLSTPYEVESSYEAMIARLEGAVKENTFIRQVINNLEASDQQVKNAFTYGMARHTLSMKFIMFSKSKDNNWTSKVYDTNSSEVTRVIRRAWENDLLNSFSGSLIQVEDSEYYVNKHKAKELFDTFKRWDSLKQSGSLADQISDKEIQNWLKEFGISLSDSAIREMKTRSLNYMTNRGSQKLHFDDMFVFSDNTSGIFGLLADYLHTILQEEDTKLESKKANHPFHNINNVLKTLSKLESKYAYYTTPKSFRDGDKNIYGYTPTKYATDAVRRLKTDEDYRASFVSKPFNNKSYLLQILDIDEAFRDKFTIDHTGITALKELGTKPYRDMSITSLPDRDHEQTKLGFFQDTEQGHISTTIGNGDINLRISRMFFQTMSDKTQMLDVSTAVLDLRDKHFVNNTDGTVGLSSVLTNFMISQLILPELSRIVNYSKTNIKNYDLASQIFIMFPELNNLRLPNYENKKLIELMINQPSKFNEEFVLNDPFVINAFTSFLQNFFELKAKDKVKLWKDYDFIKDLGDNGIDVKYLNSPYFLKFKSGTGEQVLQKAAYDYIINSYITNANLHMLIAGDMALYSKNLKKFFEVDTNGNPMVWSPKEKYGDKVYNHISEIQVGDNLSKRLALLIAPGSKISNSKDERYNHVFLRDHVDIADNIRDLVEIFYGQKEAKKAEIQIEEYNKDRSNRHILNELANSYPKVSEFLDIEGTDAQEYTTVSEHVNILFKQGRLKVDTYKGIMTKIANRRLLEREGKPIPQELMLNNDELQIILQPIKPVYTGMRDEGDVMRLVYIKSSSFPLIPEVTKGQQLDDIRKLLEQHEDNISPNYIKDDSESFIKNRNYVRASYQTANKVGALSNPLTLFDDYGNFNQELTIQDVANSSLYLERDNFRIQQDVTYKSNKGDYDKTSIGTQMLKILMSSGIPDYDGYMFNGNSYTGKQLKNKLADTFRKYINLKRELLYEELGLDENGKTFDTIESVNKIEKLLKEEAITRGYPKQSIDALKLIPTYNDIGQISTVEFNVPIWLSPNSNRFESLLNSIVDSRLSKIKLPGYSYVVGSQAGFRMKDSLEGIDESQMIFTKKYEGTLKPAEFHRDEDGNVTGVKFTQVFLPSKLRDTNGKLISFINPNGTPNNRYVERNENGQLTLKENVIDPELLNITSFRIPTSAHNSLSQVEIVGFLPQSVGDLMIVPQNLTKQKGLDFDVDKENTYHLHTHTVARTGKLVSFGSPEFREEAKEARKFYEETLELYKLNKRKKELEFQLDDIENIEDIDIADNIERVYKIKARLKDQEIPDLDDVKFAKKYNDYFNGSKAKQKIYENEIVKIHSSVLSNPDVQHLVNKVLSISFAKQQAEMIDSIVKSSDDETTRLFSPLDDEYQKKKMFSGASGKLGIGVYSNYVTFHALTNQIEGASLLNTKIDDLGNKIVTQNITRIGDITSFGILGNDKTIKPSNIPNHIWNMIERSVPDVFSERQNTATDNAKEEIMGKVNVNEITINVDCLLCAIGIDKSAFKVKSQNEADITDDQGDNWKIVNIPYLILSQPIIREYVEMMRAGQSVNAQYDPNLENKVIAELKSKYINDGEFKPSEKDFNNLFAETLYNNLSDPNGLVQATILDLFLQLNIKARKISSLQKTLNITGSGLGKSMFSTIEKYYDLANFIEDYTDTISDVTKFIGDFKDEYSIRRVEDQENYVEFKDQNGHPTFIKPLTPVGSITVNTLKAGKDIWEDYFPYTHKSIEYIIESIINISKGSEISLLKRIEIREKIFKDIKKYLVTSNHLGLYENGALAERDRLMFDTSEENMSLARYLKNITSNEKLLPDSIKYSKLVSRFSYDIKTNGMPSLIKFDSNKGEVFDEDYIYFSLLEMLAEDKPLPDYNGEPYSTQKLARDLVTYSYLGGGIQEAIEFIKYVPISYLNSLPLGKALRDLSQNTDLLGRIVSANDFNFISQYFRHNPKDLPHIESDVKADMIYSSDQGKRVRNWHTVKWINIKGEKLSEEKKKRIGLAKMISVYDGSIKKGLQKYHIFKWNNNLKRYDKITSLGTFGMPEYNINEADPESLLDTYKELNIETPNTNNEVQFQDQKTKPLNNIFGILDSTPTNIIGNIAKATNIDDLYRNVAGTLIQYIPNDLQINVGDLTNSEGVRMGNGFYDPATNQIVIDHTYLSELATPNHLAKTLLHELVHGLTSNYLNKYVDDTGKLLDSNNTPAEIKELSILYARAKDAIGLPVLQEFLDKRERYISGEDVTFSKEDTRVTYGIMNIREFATLLMTEPAFQERMSQEPYIKSGKSFLEKFNEIVIKILNKITGNNIASNGIATIMSIIETNPILKQEKKQTKFTIEELKAKALEDAIVEDDKKVAKAKNLSDNEAMSLRNLMDKALNSAELPNTGNQSTRQSTSNENKNESISELMKKALDTAKINVKKEDTDSSIDNPFIC